MAVENILSAIHAREFATLHLMRGRIGGSSTVVLSVSLQPWLRRRRPRCGEEEREAWFCQRERSWLVKGMVLFFRSERLEKGRSFQVVRVGQVDRDGASCLSVSLFFFFFTNLLFGLVLRRVWMVLGGLNECYWIFNV